MALVGTDRGTGTHNTSALTFTLSPASNFAAGKAVLTIACDNADSGGAAHSTFAVTDTLGNTWTRRISPLFDPGAAAAGVEGAVFDTDQNGGLLQTSTVITVTFDIATIAKGWTLQQVSSNAGGTVQYVTGGVNTGAATATPTVTTGSIASGDMVIGCLFNEQGTGQTVTGDSDTTNGSWSAQQTAEIGTTAAGVTVSSQRKVVTATATQTFNPTLGVSSDVILGWVQYHEATSTAYTAEVSETVSLSEAIGAVLGGIVGPSETMSLSEAVASQYGANAAPAETVALSESVASLAAFTMGAGETVALVEELAAGLLLTADVNESASLSEALGVSLGGVVGPAEALAVAESVSIAFAAAASMEEAVGLAEQLAAGLVLEVAVAESMSVGESIAEVLSPGVPLEAPPIVAPVAGRSSLASDVTIRFPGSYVEVD